MSTTETGALTVVLYDDDGLIATCECYALMCDELAATVERSSVGRTRFGRALARQLGRLHAELDELTGRRIRRGDLVRLVHTARHLITAVTGRGGRVFEIVATRLRELCDALVDEITLHDWTQVSA